MCTVTLIARKRGYLLGMNRDEKLTRIAGLPPREQVVNGRRALFPSEPAGGTWVGVNEARVSFALINWYSVPARVNGPAVSRGAVTRSALATVTSAEASALLEQLPLERTNPFRLIGVFPDEEKVVEWRWNLSRLDVVSHAWQTNIWISSGFDESGAQESRQQAFRDVLESKCGSVHWLRRLHCSHLPSPSPYSICMHREDAASVSYSEIRVGKAMVTMSYANGLPCRVVSSLTR
jgi:hypothetical protein